MTHHLRLDRPISVSGLAAVVLLGSVLACDAEQGASSDTDDEGSTGNPLSSVCTTDNDDPFADCVEAFEPADDVSFGHAMMPDIVLGSPMPGIGGGSLDVASLGCGGSITLFFDAPGIVDGPGADFIVFENPFAVGDETFTEPARVDVSADGRTWSSFECIIDEGWPPPGCAGVRVVAPPDDDTDWATDPDRSGGDAFDLSDLGLQQARFVRITDVTEAYYGHRDWCSGTAGGFDLDAVVAVPR